MEGQSEEALLAPCGEGCAGNCGDVEDDGIGLVIGCYDGAGLLDDEQARVGGVGRDSDRPVKRA